MALPAHTHPRRSRWRLYLKLTSLLVAVVFTSLTLWFIFRIEKFILERLPGEITTENLSVSFVNRAFVMTKVVIRGRKGAACEGKVIMEISELTGTFSLRHRRLTGLTVKGLQLKTPALTRECFVRKGEKPDLKLNDFAMPDGLRIFLEAGRFPVPEFGELTASTNILLTNASPDVLSIQSDRILAANGRLMLDVKGAKADFLREAGSLVLSAANLSLVLRVNDLAKIGRLKTKKLTVLAGDAELRSTAEVRGGHWKVESTLALKKIRVKGEPFLNMPMGLLRLTPENMWPMAEDSPGLVEVSVKTEAYTHQLVRAFAADMKRAVTAKIKANLKKKIPVLPF